MEKLHLSDSTYFHVVPPLTLQLHSVQKASPINLQINVNKSNRQSSHKKSQEKYIFKNTKDFRFTNPVRTISKVLSLNNIGKQLNQKGPLTQRVQNKIQQNRVPKFISKRSKEMQYRSWINQDSCCNLLKQKQSSKEKMIADTYLKRCSYQCYQQKPIKSQEKLPQNSPERQENQHLKQKRFSQDQIRAIYNNFNQISRQNQILKSEKTMLQLKVKKIQRFHQQQITAIRRRIKILEQTVDGIRHFIISQMI